MQHILDLIRQHGDLFYLITFVWTALEGETFVIFAALAAHWGLLNIHILFVCAALGSLFGDQIFFFIGRYFGCHVVNHFPKLEPKLNKILQSLEKYSTSFILSYRFMYGIRNISAFAIGMSRLTWRHFFVLNALASFVWSFVFCGGGYLFGGLMARMGLRDEASMNFEVRNVMIAVLGLFLLIVALRYFHARHAAKAESEEADSTKES